jgi:hypothetical protein
MQEKVISPPQNAREFVQTFEDRLQCETLEAQKNESAINSHINSYAAQTERLSVLTMFVRRFLPAISSARGYTPVQDTEIPENLAESRDRALLAALNEITDICSSD